MVVENMIVCDGGDAVGGGVWGFGMHWWYGRWTHALICNQ